MFLDYFGPGCLAGIRLSNWISLLSANRFRVAPTRLGKAGFITLSSLCSSLFGGVEDMAFAGRLADMNCETPIFIVGCWRSGTTHLHNLLCQDQRFGFPNMFQTMYPHTFLTCEFWLRPLLDVMTPGKRFMDNMKQGLQEPHEDEMALAIMCGLSNMLSWAFPRNASHYDRFLDFESASVEQRNLWKKSLDAFVRKVSLKSTQRLVLKSPNHTARVHLIRELYPDAKFIHIHRHPYDVYRSMCHMAGRVQPVWGLQRLAADEIPPMVVRTYSKLYDAWFRQKDLIPHSQLFEIRYDELTHDPINTLQRCYQQLELGEFDAVQPRLTDYIGATSSYQKNRHTDLSPPERDILNAEWSTYFELLGYETTA